MPGGFGPPPIVHKAPTDVFTTQVAPALDQARQAIADVGLRPHRVWLVLDQYADPSARRKEGGLQRQVLTELVPTPKVVFPSAATIALSGGLLQAGSCTLRKISRSYTKNQLAGRNDAGQDLPRHWQFYYALRPLGEEIAQFYFPSSTPVLHSTSWEITLRPLTEHGPLNGATPDP